AERGCVSGVVRAARGNVLAAGHHCCRAGAPTTVAVLAGSTNSVPSAADNLEPELARCCGVWSASAPPAADSEAAATPPGWRCKECARLGNLHAAADRATVRRHGGHSFAGATRICG